MGDRLTTCHREKSVRKPKLWPRKSETEWNRPKQWERINEKRTATRNVRTLYRAGAMDELVKQMVKYKIDVCAVQEISWPRNGTVIKRIM